MSDEPMAPVLRSWMQDTDRIPPDARHSADHVMARVEQTRQLGRSWWLPSFGRPRAFAPTTDQTTEFQPTPSLATNGQSATVTGRTRSMFSPAKAITAGALVFAIGGVLLIAQPFDQQRNSVPGAAADVEAAAPVEFTAKTKWDGSSGSGTEPARFPFIETSDPRIDGTLIWTSTSETYPGVDIEVAAVSIRIENEGGAWQAPPSIFNFTPPPVFDERGREVEGEVGGSDEGSVRVFVGEDGYEGLFVVVEDTFSAIRLGSDLHGYIIEGELPVAVELWSAE